MRGKKLKNRRVAQKNAFTLVELLVVIAIFGITVLCLAPVVNRMRERAHRIQCANNIRRISLGLHMYATDRGEAFPPTLGALYPQYVKDDKTFDCPASKPTGTPGEPDYDYTAGLTESSPQTEAIVYDRAYNHGVLGRNVLRIDGSVEWTRSREGKPQ